MYSAITLFRRTLVLTLSVALILSLWYSQDVRRAAGDDKDPLLCPTGDVNGDAAIDIADPIYLLAYLFSGGPEPVPIACADENPDEEFTRDVAGTFLVCIEGDASGVFLATINADGTDAVTGDTDFRLTPFSRFRSPTYGAWHKSDDYQTTHIELQFLYDEEGNLAYVKRLISVANWPEDFEGYTGTWNAELFTVEAVVCDPGGGPVIDPRATPVVVASGTIRANRVNSH